MQLKKIIIPAIFVFMICFQPINVLAQGPGFEEDVEDTPLDMGVSFITIATAVYSYKILQDRKK